MQQIIEKLLILQDRDRRIMHTRDQLARIQPERESLQGHASATQASLDAVKTKVKQVESDRKKLELEAESKKQQIERYSLQQFQTKKNEEYRALAHEIDTCKEGIAQLEDQQLELMEKAESLQKESGAAARQADDARKMSEGQLQNLAAREQNLRQELTELESNRNQLTAEIDERPLRHYERLLRNKGDNVVVGIEHGVCGGCHMRFPVQLLVSCQAAKELVTCPNCGRILYYTRDMDLAVAD
jgi:predicted  nucleic acid-binding Zn-ribbon protein